MKTMIDTLTKETVEGAEDPISSDDEWSYIHCREHGDVPL
jgi:hypothetical protein